MDEVTTLPAKVDPTMGFTNPTGFDLIQRAGTLLSKSTLVPKDYQNNLPNCCIALNIAARLNADPLMVMQNLYVIQGRPGWSAQFLIATFNTCGRFTSITYSFVGKEGTDGWGCFAATFEKATGSHIVGETVTIAMAKKEGWYQKQGSKWQSMPGQMLRYRAATFLIRATAPEIGLGLSTADEIEDFMPERKPTRVVVTPDSLTTDATVVSHDMAQVTHERGELLALLESERTRINLTDLEWSAVVRDAIGEQTTLEFADVAVLHDLLAELQPMAAKR